MAGLLLSLAISPTPTLAQERALRFDRVIVEDGLANGSVRAIHQDGQGFVWLGTDEGLNRYDGYRFRVYRHDPDDPRSLSGNKVQALYSDSRGELWIGTRKAGLNRLRRDSGTFDHYRHDPSAAESLSHDEITSLFEDAVGDLWVGTADGLNRLRLGDAAVSGDASVESSLSGRYIFAIDQDRAGELWIGTDGGLVRLPDPRRTEGWIHYRHDPAAPGGLSGQQVWAIAADPDGTVWIGTDHGLDRLDPDDGVVHYRHDLAARRGSSGAWVTALLADQRGELWIGTRGSGLVRFDHAEGTFTRSLHDPADPRSLAGNFILSLHEDATGVVWVGSNAGISRYDPLREPFAAFRPLPGRDSTLSQDSTWALLEDRSGVLWVGTPDSGLDRFDRQRREVFNYRFDPGDPAGLQPGPVTTLYQDRAGDLWVGTWGGLSRLERPLPAASKRPRFVHYPPDPQDPERLRNGEIQKIYEDRAGRLWIGTLAGLHHFDRARGRFVRYPRPSGDPLQSGDPEGLATEGFYAIYEGRAGDLWFGSRTGGLYRLTSGSAASSGRFEHYQHDSTDRGSLSSNSVASVFESRSGALWVGTFGAGLNRLAPAVPGEERRRFAHYRKRDGLPSDWVLDVLEDDEGRLWLSTSHGLSRFDPRSETFKNYGVSDGLHGRAFVAVCAFRSSSGEMFFGGDGGFTAFFPEQVAADPVAPVVAITDFQLLNESVPLSSREPGSALAKPAHEPRELVLTHRDYIFAFEFAALHYASPRENRYAYRLEGFDPDWIPTGAERRFAQYSNLDPGNYVFRVKASNPDGVWNEDGASIQIAILPPPWRTWWAYTLYVLALVAAVLGTLRSHRQELRRERAVAEERARLLGDRERLISELEGRNAELARFNYTVAHDLKNPLTTIRNFIDLSVKDAEAGDQDRLHADLRRVDHAAAKLHRLLDELYEFSCLDRVSMPFEEVAFGELVRQAVDELGPMLSEREVEVEVAAALPVVRGDRARLLEVARHLLANAVKYLGRRERGRRDRGGDPPAARIEVGVRAASEGEPSVLYVRDNGLGVDPKYHDKIFELFERLDPEASEGTGIGLALVQRIVEAHGGQIWVESEGDGCGSTFCFTLGSGPEEATSPSGRQ